MSADQELLRVASRANTSRNRKRDTAVRGGRAILCERRLTGFAAAEVAGSARLTGDDEPSAVEDRTAVASGLSLLARYNVPPPTPFVRSH